MLRLFLLSLVFLALSCKDDKTDPVELKGAIFITVKFNNQFVTDAVITTEPATSMVMTDLTGTAIISDVPVGGYKVSATHPGIGSGSAPVTVTAATAKEVVVNLIGGVFEAPAVNIITPSNNATLDFGSDIVFSATVTDSEDAPNTLDITWSSSRDGVLWSNPPSGSGNSTFTINTLSEGAHVISLTAKDSDDRETSDQINVTIKKLPNAVTLSPIEVTQAGLQLQWSVSDETTFAEYRITRSEELGGPYETIDIHNDIQQTEYADADLMIGTRYYYQIIVAVTNGDKSLSNIQSGVFEGDHISVGVSIVQMLIDKQRPYIYALDKVNNSLLFIHKENRIVEKTIFVGSSPTDLDVSTDNQKLYIANLGSNQIAVVDLASQEKINDLFVDTEQGSWDGNPYSLVYLTGNYLAYTSEDQWNNIKIVNAANGAFVSYAGSIHTPFLNTNPARNVVYGLDGGDVIRFNFSNGTLTEVDETNMSSGTSRKIVVSGDGLALFRGNLKFLANNLSSQLGTLGEPIYACNSNGSIAIGKQHIWNATEFSIIRPMPVSSDIMELDQDDSTLYVYDKNSSNIYLIQIQ